MYIAQKIQLGGNKGIMAATYQMIIEPVYCWEGIWYTTYKGCWQKFNCKFINVTYDYGSAGSASFNAIL